jgi:L-threonylcarbamoyladenylate synthase
VYMITNNFSDFPMDKLKPAVFLNRDATIIDTVGLAAGTDQIRLFSDTIPALQILSRNYDLFVLAHESGISDNRVSCRQVAGVNLASDDLLRRKSVRIKKWYVCPHSGNHSCRCMTPNSTLMQEAAARYGIDLSQSFMIGNHPDDVRCGESIGVFGLYLLSGGGARHLTDLPSDRLVFHSLLDAAHWIGRHPKPAEQLEASVRRASAVVKQGGLVAFPTETVYGLGADAFNPQAIARIYEAKGRPLHNPLIVHISDIEQLESLVDDIPLTARSLIDRFWPGPLTLVFRKKHCVPDIVTAGHPTVAVRMPIHPLAAKLIRLSETPIAAPSANIFGRTSATSASHVLEQLHNACDVLIDGGACRIGLESTVVSVAGPKLVLLRPGSFNVEELETAAGTDIFTGAPATDPDKMQSPGMLTSHYQTVTPLYITSDAHFFSDRPDVGVLLFENTHRAFAGPVRTLSPSGDLKEAAVNLYTAMRGLDALDLCAIVAELLPERGLGLAINDRLRKASVKSKILHPTSCAAITRGYEPL